MTKPTPSSFEEQLIDILTCAAKAAQSGDYLCKACNRFKNWDFAEKRFHCDSCD